MIAIDPGPTESAICQIHDDMVFASKVPNERLLDILSIFTNEEMAIEMIASYGMPVGMEVFETCVWIGRFIQCHGGLHRLIYRKDVKIHLCGSMKANDSNIRKALIDRFGEPGTKKNKGKLYGVKKDMWSALAVWVTANDSKLKF